MTVKSIHDIQTLLFRYNRTVNDVYSICMNNICSKYSNNAKQFTQQTINICFCLFVAIKTLSVLTCFPYFVP